MIFFIVTLAITYVLMNAWLKYYLDGPSEAVAVATRPEYVAVDEEEWAPVDGSLTWEDQESDDQPLEANRD